jgi:cytochrome c553
MTVMVAIPNATTPEAAHDVRKGYLGKPKTLDIPAYCGKCHSDANLMKRFNPSLRVDQEREYYTSVHGRLLKEKGETRVATCISCHSVHGIPRAERSALFRLSEQRGDDVREMSWKRRVHEALRDSDEPVRQLQVERPRKDALRQTDLSAPTCNDCHGNHGATPPGIASVANVCGSVTRDRLSCFRQVRTRKHSTTSSSANASPATATTRFPKPGDAMIGTQQGALCINCHTQGDKGFVAAGDNAFSHR